MIDYSLLHLGQLDFSRLLISPMFYQKIYNWNINEYFLATVNVHSNTLGNHLCSLNTINGMYETLDVYIPNVILAVPCPSKMMCK